MDLLENLNWEVKKVYHKLLFASLVVWNLTYLQTYLQNDLIYLKERIYLYSGFGDELVTMYTCSEGYIYILV